MLFMHCATVGTVPLFESYVIKSCFVSSSNDTRFKEGFNSNLTYDCFKSKKKVYKNTVHLQFSFLVILFYIKIFKNYI